MKEKPGLSRKGNKPKHKRNKKNSSVINKDK